MRTISSFKDDFVDFVFPKICIISDERLPEGNSNNFIKDELLEKLELVKKDKLVLARAKINSDFFLSKYAFRTDNEIQTLIHYLKYKGFSKIGEFLGRIIGALLLDKYTEELSQFDLLMPVPLFVSKERERGYNQSYHICRGISDAAGLDILNDKVLRIKNTKSQTGLTYDRRIENVKNAFIINDKCKTIVDGKGILVVDDVITTGSTIKEVIRILKETTYSKVGAVTVSMAED
ncbi:MAG: phosphoribosyltransferase family protein [Ignavibacteria bacterium]|nr:phosphoribosyltransferase family protein [Ignavibacteria bacterium]